MSEERGPNGHFAPGNKVGPRIPKGTSLNPGGIPKTRKELRLLAREGLPKAFERARQILDDDNADWRAWMEAGKFLGAFSFSQHQKDSDDEAMVRRFSALSVDERRAIAKMKMSSEQPDAPVDPDATN